ncbi:hypothetical protein SAMN05880568_0308 [Microbacterium sp. RURRCA19A]|nr:hypothetical protein SAMN05880568_0308 [Microbacterium sp. RURRCA19A]
MVRARGPLPPRVSAPDLPREFDDVGGLGPRADLFAARIVSLEGHVDAAHSTLAECSVAEASVDSLVLTGATLTDVEFATLRATELLARDGRWRNVAMIGGRVGTLDLSGADLDSVEIRGVRIDFLSLRGATVRDVLVADCVIGTLDLPLAKLARVRFEGCRADEVDADGLRAEHADLRGLDAVSFGRPDSLRGVTLTHRQVELAATDFARALGIDVQD